MGKKGVLLVNLGTPDSTSVGDVRRYLREFLMDKRVIDIPSVPRWLLVNGIIAPFRAPRSASEYRKLFTDRGSPLKYYTEDLTRLVQQQLGDDYQVDFAMRYQNPSIPMVLDRLKAANCTSIHVIPLFPQYASATTGSVIERVMDMVSQWQVIPEMRFTSQFFEHPQYINTIARLGKERMEVQDYDHCVFSYHGLPERQILKADDGGFCQLGRCCDEYQDTNRYCYRAQCFHTSRLIAGQLGLPGEKYTVCFQSRLGNDPWVKPYTEEVLHELASRGIKKVLAFSPAFVSDCLETTIEVGETYREEFVKAGGEQWDLVPGLNTEASWVDCLADLVTRHPGDIEARRR